MIKYNNTELLDLWNYTKSELLWKTESELKKLALNWELWDIRGINFTRFWNDSK